MANLLYSGAVIALFALLVVAAWVVYRTYRVRKVRAWAEQQGWTCQAGKMFHPRWFRLEGPGGWEMESFHRQPIARENISFTVWRAKWDEPTDAALFCGPRPPRPPEPLEFGGMLIQVALQLMIGKPTAQALAHCQPLDFGESSFLEHFIVCGDATATAERVLSPASQAQLAAWPTQGRRTFLPVLTVANGILEIRVKTWLVHPHTLIQLVELGETIRANHVAPGARMERGS